MCLIFQATVLEEMPAFPERESSILAVLKKKKPGRVPENEIRPAHNVQNHQPDSTTPHVSYSLLNTVECSKNINKFT